MYIVHPSTAAIDEVSIKTVDISDQCEVLFIHLPNGCLGGWDPEKFYAETEILKNCDIYVFL